MEDQTEMREALDEEPYDTLPTVFTASWVTELGKRLVKTTWKGQHALKQFLSPRLVVQILAQAVVLAKGEPTLVEVKPASDGATVTVVGDTHGQVHDLLNLFETAGYPSQNAHYVFNGDFVDRGAWGLEVLLVLAAWKIAFPGQVTLLRGNHETTTCTMMYGFKGELLQKFSKEEVKGIYAICKKLFASLPLAACIGGATLILHGGLFRKPTPTGGSKSKSKRKQRAPAALNGTCELGTLADLRAAGKGGPDPNGRGATGLATDVLWSDPVATPGIQLNFCRGVGTIFGPDVTQRFLEENGLKLILRSHEGPDARYDRTDMPNMQQGWTLDHKVDAGQLMTVFSAPDYPQFQADDSDRYGNMAAVAKLRGPDWHTPEMIQFGAVHPRPPAVACYDYIDVPGSDEEIEFAATEASGASSAASDLKDTATQPGSPPIHEAAASAMEEEGTRPNEFRTAAQINSPFSAMEESEGGAECDLSDRIAEGPLSTGHTRPASSEVPADVPGLESCPMSDEEEPKKSGRELEQAAAQILAVEGGATQESPSPVRPKQAAHENGDVGDVSFGLTPAEGQEEEQSEKSNKRALGKAPEGQQPAKRGVKAASTQGLARPARLSSQKAPWR